MSEELELYRCEICNTIVEVVQGGAGALVCCGQEMTKIKEQHDSEHSDRHVPTIEFDGVGKNRKVKIQVGKELHPMINEHYIKFIEAISKDGVYLKRKVLHPNEEPKLEFLCDCEEMIVREYCNLHGLWSVTI